MSEEPVIGRLALDNYAGRTTVPVAVLGETPTKYRIRAITMTRLAGRNRWLLPGKTALVPKRAVRDTCSRCDGLKGGVPGNENVIDGKPVCDYCTLARAPEEEKEGKP